MEYLIEFEHRYDKAQTSSGLVINDVGRSHMLLKFCHVDGRTKSQIMLLVGHDLSRYADIFGHLHRMAKSDSVPGVSSNSTFAGETGDFDEDGSYRDAYNHDGYDPDDEDWWDEEHWEDYPVDQDDKDNAAIDEGGDWEGGGLDDEMYD